MPLPLGGACVEAGHTALLWRQAGVDVQIVPTAPVAPDNPWPARLAAAGCRIVEANLDNLQTVPGLSGGIVAMFCNWTALRAWPLLESLRCRVVWSPCMCYLTHPERTAFKTYLPAALHFQSRYQQQAIAPWLDRLGCPRRRRWRIPGALAIDEFPYCPRPRDGGEFVVGRLARPCPSKWSRLLWETLGAVRRRGIALRAELMAWSDELTRHCGPPPPWAATHAAGEMPAAEFLRRCHVLLSANASDTENWPRCGLEAMACGVPVVAERRGGWREMIREGQTGLLYDTPAECVDALTRLGENEMLRLQLAANARRSVEQLTAAATIGRRWLELFGTLTDAGYHARRAA